MFFPDVIYFTCCIRFPLCGYASERYSFHTLCLPLGVNCCYFMLASLVVVVWGRVRLKKYFCYFGCISVLGRLCLCGGMVRPFQWSYPLSLYKVSIVWARMYSWLFSSVRRGLFFFSVPFPSCFGFSPDPEVFAVLPPLALKAFVLREVRRVYRNCCSVPSDFCLEWGLPPGFLLRM